MTSKPMSNMLNSFYYPSVDLIRVLFNGFALFVVEYFIFLAAVLQLKFILHSSKVFCSKLFFPSKKKKNPKPQSTWEITRGQQNFCLSVQLIRQMFINVTLIRKQVELISLKQTYQLSTDTDEHIESLISAASHRSKNTRMKNQQTSKKRVPNKERTCTWNTRVVETKAI